MTHAISHVVNRLIIDSEDTFDDVRQRYESHVPTLDLREFAEVVASGDLTRVQEYTTAHTPNGFVNFWTLDPMPVMRLHGHQRQAITYNVGNNLIAETMFRHDPAIILYAPLRLAINEGSEGLVQLSIDQPSSKFASFGDPRIAEVGVELDAKLANLLVLMSLPVPPELGQRAG